MCTVNLVFCMAALLPNIIIFDYPEVKIWPDSGR
jgi:hypothetical protein